MPRFNHGVLQVAFNLTDLNVNYHQLSCLLMRRAFCPRNMAQIRLLDSVRMSKLLEDALSWSPAVSSLLVSASNGSILAYAFRSDTPSIKEMRTLSTTMTAAYTAAAENTLVYESQSSSTISVIGPVADHVLLAVTGAAPTNTTAGRAANSEDISTDAKEDTDTDDEEGEEEDSAQAETRLELELISEELATILREELRDMRWPDDI
jgi:hypothetical protein